MVMTKDDLNRVFDLVGFSTTDKDLTQIFLDFASVIEEEEREACAELTDEFFNTGRKMLLEIADD